MRRNPCFLLAFAFLLVGCGTPFAASPTPTPVPTAPPKSVASNVPHYRSYPPMTINKNHRYLAVVQTNRGSFTINLLPKVAPLAVNSFVFLARHHYFDGDNFIRVIQAFMIQTGDPTNTGTGNPGYEFNDEPVHQKYTVGTVAMANSGPNTNGSQFFIVTGPEGASLQPKYTIFGRVTHGMPVVEKIAATPVGENLALNELSQPLVRVYMKHIVIHETQ